MQNWCIEFLWFTISPAKLLGPCFSMDATYLFLVLFGLCVPVLPYETVSVFWSGRVYKESANRISIRVEIKNWNLLDCFLGIMKYDTSPQALFPLFYQRVIPTKTCRIYASQNHKNGNWGNAANDERLVSKGLILQWEKAARFPSSKRPCPLFLTRWSKIKRMSTLTFDTRLTGHLVFPNKCFKKQMLGQKNTSKNLGAHNCSTKFDGVCY